MSAETNKTVIDILNLAKQHGVELWVENEALKFRAYSDHFPDDLRNLLKCHKPEIITYLTSNSDLAHFNVKEQEHYEVAFAQERLWFVTRLAENTTQYNIPLAYELNGKIDKTIFIRACTYLVERHAALRTSFCEVQGKVKQIVHTNFAIEKALHYSELTDQDDKKSGVTKLIQSLNDTCFDLETPPLFKIYLIKINETQHLLGLCFHHIIADEYSIELLMQELSLIYESLRDDVPAKLNDVGLRYVDYAAWQRRELERSSEKFKHYWQQAINPEEQKLDFPYDYKLKPYASYQGKRLNCHHVLDEEAQQKLAQLQSGGTIFNVLLAVYFVFLYRYTGQKLITVGIPFTNRTRPALKNVFGMFVNSLPIQIQLDGTVSFSEVLNQVKQKVLEAYRYGEFPFEKIIDALAVPRNAAHNPLFQTMFFSSSAGNGFKLADCNVAKLKLEINTSKFDFSVVYAVNENSVDFEIEYNLELLKTSTVQRFSKHLINILSAVIATPDKPIAELPLLSAEEQRWSIFEINQNQKPFRENVRVIELFEEMVDQYPEATAVEYLQDKISYRELNQKANQLAHYLREQGVGPEKCVVVFMERSIDVAIAFLGTMKAGGVFIPLDIEYPQARIEHILDDSQADIILSHKQHVDKLKFASQLKLVIDRHQFQAFDNYSHDNLKHLTCMDDLVYIIYTSGSTGKPKGVMIKQSGLAHYILWAIEHYQCRKGSGSPAHSSLGFDLTITTVFAPLCCGKTVFMTPEELSVEGLLDALKQRQDYSIIKITPAHLKLFQELLPKEILKKLFATVVIGGEALYADDLAFWRQHSPNMRFINEYGATETSVACTIYEVGSELPETTSLPVGKAIPNSSMFVLDERLQPQPIGVIGEIYLGGNQIARGYLNRPELNEKKFLPTPFPALIGDRIYKTGDYGRLLEDGNVVFVGRIDDQVKVNGYRIELGEIENCLAELNTVKQAVCTVCKSDVQGKYIAAYVVPDSAKSLTAESIKNNLKTKLPDYMIPRFVVFLAELPLTINGKVDVKALPDPELSTSYSQNQTFAPRTQAEILLHQIWCELFQRQSINIKDNFFRLGGDSISSLQMIFQAKKHGLSIKPKQVFSHQSIEELAAVASWVRQEIDVLCPQGQIPLTPIQAWFFSLPLAEPNHWNQAFVLQSTRALNLQDLNGALLKLAEIHAALRMRFLKTSEGWQQEYLPACSVDIVADEIDSEAVEPSALKQAMQRCQQALDIQRGKLFHALLIKGKLQHRILLAVHHLVVDGVSWRILIEDLSLLLNNENRSALPAQTTAFGYWPMKLHDYVKTLPEQTLDYWQTVSAKAQNKLQLALSVTPCLEKEVTSVKRSLSKEKTAFILSIAENYNLKLQELLLAALTLQLKPAANQLPLVIDLEGHGREDVFENIDLTRTVGWFTSSFPFVLPTDSVTVDELLFTIRHTLNNLPDNGFSYGVLRYLHADAAVRQSLATNSAICFNHLGTFSTLSDGQTLALTFDEAGSSVSGSNLRPYAINLNTYVYEEAIHINLMANANEIVCNDFAEDFLEQLYRLTKSIAEQPRQVQLMNIMTMANYADTSLILNLHSQHISKIYPLTSMQQGMLYHSLYAPENNEYVCQMCWELQGEVTVKKIQQAWQRVMQKHEVLRSSFVWEETADIYRIVLTEYPVPLTVHPVDESTSLEALLDEDFKQGFDLSVAPAYRLKIIQQKNKVFLVWTFHHIILDGWSVSQIMADFQLAYSGQYIGTSTFSFEAYMKWLKAQSRIKTLTYWKNYLQGMQAQSFFAPSHKEKSNIYLEKIQRLDPKLSSKISDFASEQEITLNSLFLTVVGAVLAMVHQRNEVVMGMTLSGRSAAVDGIEDAVGNFLNTIPIRIKFHEEINLATLSKSVHNDLIAHQGHEFVSLADIQHDLKAESKENLIEILYVFENYPRKALQNTSLTLSNLKAKEYANYPLTFIVAATSAGVEIKLTYDKSRLDENSIEKYFNLMLRLLNNVTQPEAVLDPVFDTVAGFFQNELSTITHSAFYDRPEPVHTELSGKLLKICSEVLGIDDKNLHLQQSFSDAGGTSLSAIRMVSRLRREFDITLSLKEFAACQSLYELAILLQAKTNRLAFNAEEFEEVKV